MTEAAVVASIERTLKARRAWWFKTHGSGNSRRGIPDLIGCYRGRALALEVKAPGRVSTVSRLQTHELDQARAAGAAAWVVTSADAVTEILDQIDKDVADDQH